MFVFTTFLRHTAANDDIGKDVCSREFSTCLSTGDDSVKGQCEVSAAEIHFWPQFGISCSFISTGLLPQLPRELEAAEA